MTFLGHLTEVRRYPVKSLGGEILDSVEIEPRGLVGDRLWALRDERGKFGSGKTTRRFQRIDGLLAFHARYEGDVPVVSLPDGGSLRGDDTSVHSQLSAAIGTPVELVREAQVSHFDAGAVHLCTTSSLAHLQASIGSTAADVRRFRPNLVIEVNEAASWAEDSWLGWRVRIGATVELSVRERTTRCVMVDLAQGDLPVDSSVLAHLSAQNDSCFGVYADVVRPGRITVGDEVHRVH